MSDHARNRTKWTRRSGRKCGPSRKVRFQTEHDATRETERAAERSPNLPPLDVYGCGWCGGWHLTSEAQRR